MRLGAVTAILLALAIPASAQDRAVPYWVATKSGQAMMRTGPAETYPGIWLYKRRGLPLKVIKLHGTWRQVQDPDGDTGWMLVSLLTERRTGLVKPGEPRPMHEDASESSRVRYRAEAGVVGQIEQCRGGWCRFKVGNREGWIRSGELWGVSPDEVVD